MFINFYPQQAGEAREIWIDKHAGYVLIERAADAAVAKGIGYTKLGKVTKHVTKATEAPVWKGTRADLTVDSFKASTGWEV